VVEVVKSSLVTCRFYECANHLGNVLITISDRKKQIAQASPNQLKVRYYKAIVINANDYYPFGMQMPGRKYNRSTKRYRFGFNGKEADKEAMKEGNMYDYGFRIYNPRIAKFLSVDPLTKGYPWYTPYQFAGNKPINCVDLDGAEERPYYSIKDDSNWYHRTTISTAAPARAGFRADYVHLKEYSRSGDGAFSGSEYYVYKLTQEGGSYKQFGFDFTIPTTTFYFVFYPNTINKENTSLNMGVSVPTAGTNWHYYGTSKTMSDAFKSGESGVNGLGTGIFGAAAIGAAIPAAVVAAPAVGQGARWLAPKAAQAGRWAWKNLLTNGGQIVKYNAASGAGDFLFQTIMNKGDITKNNLVSTGANLFLGPLTSALAGYTLNVNLKGDVSLENPFTPTGILSVAAGTVGNKMGGFAGNTFAGKTPGVTGLPFSSNNGLSWLYNTSGNVIGNIPQAAVEKQWSKE
jgi:RHS repeat-associated protein